MGRGSGGAWAGQGSRDVLGRVSCSCPRPVGSYSLARRCPIEPIFLPQWCRSHVMSCAWSQPDLRFAGASGASCEISRQNSAPQQPHPPGALWPLQPPILCPIKVGMTKVGIWWGDQGWEGDAEHWEGCMTQFPQGELGVGGLPGDAEFSPMCQPGCSLLLSTTRWSCWAKTAASPGTGRTSSCL